MHKYLTAIFLMMAGTASAQQMSMSDKMALRDNCKQDIQTLCPNAKPGGGEVLACIKEKKEQLSEQCSTTIAAIVAQRKN